MSSNSRSCAFICGDSILQSHRSPKYLPSDINSLRDPWAFLGKVVRTIKAEIELRHSGSPATRYPSESRFGLQEFCREQEYFAHRARRSRDEHTEVPAARRCPHTGLAHCKC